MTELADLCGVRLCAYQLCSAPLVRRPQEKPSQFAARTCCDASCANRKAKGSTVPADLPTEKTCKECGGLTRQRKRESANRWATRECCCRVCASRYNMRQINLGRSDGTPPDPCALEGCDNPAAGKYCSRDCAAQAQRKNLTPCHREGCDNPTKSKFCSRTCVSLARRNPSGDARREGRKREAARKAGHGAPKRKLQPKPAPQPVVLTVEEMRPAPEDLLPDPAVTAMDVKRQAAGRLLDNGAEPADVAAELGVSIAQVRRWDEGAA